MYTFIRRSTIAPMLIISGGLLIIKWRTLFDFAFAVIWGIIIMNDCIEILVMNRIMSIDKIQYSRMVKPVIGMLIFAEALMIFSIAVARIGFNAIVGNTAIVIAALLTYFAARVISSSYLIIISESKIYLQGYYLERFECQLSQDEAKKSVSIGGKELKFRCKDNLENLFAKE